MGMHTQIFKPSELIINSRGAVYHLNIRPDELASNVILVGDPARTERVARYFDTVECKNEHREFKWITGTIGSERITVLSSGIGTDNIDIVLNELDALANIDFETRKVKEDFTSLHIMRLGTSGSLSSDIPAGSIVVSAYCMGTDGLLNYYVHTPSENEKSLTEAFIAQTDYPSAFAKPYAGEADAGLLDILSAEAFTGITVTACGFYGPQGRILRAQPQTHNLLERFQKVQWNGLAVTNFEMETSAIYGLSKILGHKAVSVSVIVANRIRGEFSSDADADVDKMIRYSLKKVFGA
jgi:uridine phosphorylase